MKTSTLHSDYASVSNNYILTKMSDIPEGVKFRVLICEDNQEGRLLPNSPLVVAIHLSPKVKASLEW